MSRKYSYPFSYAIDANINIHIEHIDTTISCIWFDNNNQEEQNIPMAVAIYNSNNELVPPFRNTQSFAISRNGSYKIKYNDKTIIVLETIVYPCNPPISENKIKVVDLRDNYTKIKAIEEIVNPFFTFEMDDFYGDRGGIPYPKIEELTRLYFKKNSKDRNLVITKEEEQLLLIKIEKLDIGSVEIIKFPYIGCFICIDMIESLS